MEHLLEIKGLQIETLRGKKTVRLLDKVDLNIGRKCSFGIVGESGCGKTPAAMFVSSVMPSTSIPPCRAAMTSGTVEPQSSSSGLNAASCAAILSRNS